MEAQVYWFASSPFLSPIRLAFHGFGTIWEAACGGYTYRGDITNKKYTFWDFLASRHWKQMHLIIFQVVSTKLCTYKMTSGSICRMFGLFFVVDILSTKCMGSE